MNRYSWSSRAASASRARVKGERRKRTFGRHPRPWRTGQLVGAAAPANIVRLALHADLALEDSPVERVLVFESAGSVIGAIAVDIAERHHRLVTVG